MVAEKHEKYSILNQLDPSPEQMPAVLERGADVVVTAGAGTGKTRTLVARFLALLADGVPLRAIVAITFTIKAAREMRNRIREEIRVYLLNQDLAVEDRAFWSSIYENLDSARISTIHSFAADVLRQHPAELGLDPGFDLMDEGLSARSKNLAVDASLAWAAENSRASILFSAYGDWRLKRVVRGLLDRRLELRSAAEKPLNGLWELWKPILTDKLSAFVDDPEIQGGLNEFIQYEADGILEKAASANDQLVEDLEIVIKHWRRILAARKEEDWITISRCLPALRAHLKQKGKNDNWAPAEPKKIIKSIQEQFDDRLPGIEMDLAVDQKLADKIVPGLLAVFNTADQWYTAYKDRIQALDFDDLEAGVLRLFEEFPEVRAAWQEQIQALLVDEYQDTNARQRSMINMLNGSRKQLFIVGDGKQSIYRFRGADVAVFRQERDRIAAEGASFELSTSYRSLPELLQNLNGLLLPVLGLDSRHPWVEPFSPLLPGRVDDAPRDLAPNVELHLAIGTKAEGASRIAAQGAASRIQSLVGPASIEGDDKSTRTHYAYGDIAVLCRASSSFGVYEEAFEEFGIPYLTIAGQGFYDRPEIRNLINTLRVFADAEDDLSLAGMLRSPEIAIPDDVIFLVRKFQQDAGQPSLMQALLSYDSGEDKALQYRISYLIRIVKKFTRLGGRLSVSDLLNQYVGETGYLAALYLMGDQRGAQNVKKLISDAELSGIVSLEEYLNTIAELRDSAVREGEAQGVEEGAVQIMTVHQAKGMEFPIVILGDVSKRNRQLRDILIDGQFGLLPPFSEIRIDHQAGKKLITGYSLAYEMALKTEREMEDAETRRLFYVASTRAEDLLILNGVTGKLSNNQVIGKTGGWLSYLVELFGLSERELDCDPEGDQIRTQRVAGANCAATLLLYEGNHEFEKAGMPRDQIPGVERTVNIRKALTSLSDAAVPKSAAMDAQEEIYPLSKTGKSQRAPARIVGDVVHKALQLWLFPSQGETEFNNWAEAEFKREGVVQKTVLQNGIKRVINLLERFQDHALYERMSAADRLLHEVPFSFMSEEGQLEKGLIDALFKTGDDWFLVEFKSDQIRDDRRFDYVWTNKGYQAQVGRYLHAVEGIIGQKPAGILCFLNYADRIHLIEDFWD